MDVDDGPWICAQMVNVSTPALLPSYYVEPTWATKDAASV